MPLFTISWGQVSILLAVIVTTLLARSFWISQRTRQKERELGCRPANRYPHRWPWGLDLFRDRLKAVKVGRYNWLFLEHFRRYGDTWEERTFGTRTINTIETANIQAVATARFDDYGKGSAMRNKALSPFLGHGILSEDGPAWKRSRDLIMPLFKRAELSDLESFTTYVDTMLTHIPRDGSTVDLQPLLHKLFLDSSSEFLFGESFNTLTDETGAHEEFLEAFSDALSGAGKRGNLAGGRLGFLFKGSDKRWKKSCKIVHDRIDYYVARALAATDPINHDDHGNNNNHHDKSPPKSRRKYILIYEMAKTIRDPVKLRSEILNVFFPARGTTAIAVANTLFFIARTPHVWAELRRQALALQDGPLTFEVLKSLALFRYALFEGIRLQGPSGRVSRTAVRDTILPCGGGPDGSHPVFVPKGTQVALNNFPRNHDPDLWGKDDVEQFNPRRFEGKVLKWEFAPFLGGQRICPAQQQVQTQAVYLLVRMAQEFETIENRDPNPAYVEEIKMLCESRNGVQVALYAPSKEQ